MDALETISLLLTPIWSPIRFLLRIIEKIMFVMILLYDNYCYSPLQKALSPLVAMIPRTLVVGNNTVTVFTANIVSWSRTLLVIPIAMCLKYDYTTTACLCVVYHDFLDHVDGIVAKVQKKLYGELDDPLLGGFMDAFCDKIVICTSLWTILMVTDFSGMMTSHTCVFVGVCVIIIAYEFSLAVVRVQDYFAAYYQRKYNDVTTYQPNIAAAMEGKLKEKLESVGIACLCVCQSAKVPIQSTSGIIGIACLVLSIRLAHASLVHKLNARWAQADAIVSESQSEAGVSESQSEAVKGGNRVKLGRDADPQTENTKPSVDYKRRQSVFDDVSDGDSSDEKSDASLKEDAVVKRPRTMSAPGGPRRRRTLSRSKSVAAWPPEANKVDKVYTIGCFDLFHEGHEILMQRLKQLGTQVIVGVHDSRSIYKLKKKVPIDSTSRRMANVKRFADIVFCIHGTDPSPYIESIFDNTEGLSSLYVRGDDMKNFPSRDVTETLMPVHFLPYTTTVSSTKLRKEIYNASQFGPHVKHDDHTMFY